MGDIQTNDLIKALRCLASQGPEGECYEDYYNFGREDGMKMSCQGYLEGTIPCPYHQSSYDVCFEDGDCCEWLITVSEMIKELQQYKELEEQGRLVKLPTAVGSKVYEIIEETVPSHYFYISEYKVQDVSAAAVKYCDDWTPLGYKTLYFTKEAAEKALEEMKNE